MIQIRLIPPETRKVFIITFSTLYNDFLWLTCSTAMRRQKWGGTTRVKHKQINKGFTFSARHSGQEESGHGNMKLWPSNELNFKQRNSENHRENGAPHSELILKPNNQTTLLCDLRLCGQFEPVQNVNKWIYQPIFSGWNLCRICNLAQWPFLQLTSIWEFDEEAQFKVLRSILLHWEYWVSISIGRDVWLWVVAS